ILAGINGQVVVWAKYRHDIEAIVDLLGADALAQFHGGISERRRARELERFRSGKARIFLATPQCGGHGLTLNEASTVIFYSNGFKFSERIQAEDRTHRIGQNRSVLYIDLWAYCGIEDRIRTALSDKSDVVESFRREIEAIKDTKRADRDKAIKKLKERL
ncbi:MAG: helicase-related protein, partial [Lentisphaeria bacterium]